MRIGWPTVQEGQGSIGYYAKLQRGVEAKESVL